MKNKAFTLIELLVVVLIIGILAAVAVPQYQKAVQKARFMQIVTAAKTLYDAQVRYYLANGEYTVKLEDLDVRLPGRVREETQSVVFPIGHCALDYYALGVSSQVGCSVARPSSFYAIQYQTGKKICCAYDTDSYAAEGLCKQLFPNSSMYLGCTTQYCHCYSE